ncbi:unnamed protein product, partial [Iphiclides podalirius]
MEKNQQCKESVSLPKTSDDLNEEPKNVIIKTPGLNDKEKAVPSPKVDSPIKSIEKNKKTPKHLKVSVKSPSVIKTNISIFSSPQLRRNSPTRKDFASPLAPSPKHSIKSLDDRQIKPISPQREKLTPNTQIINENNELQITDRNIKKVTHNTASPLTRNEDYNVPSVPESITDDTVMDGIIPLQSEGSAPKPIDLLKNEIISENVEVLFDPIVPLPSPSKVRPKLRPVPRLGPLRRSSVQGSASESEDETRRAQMSGGAATPSLARQRHDSHSSHTTLHSLPNREVSRVRNDSICSNVSQTTAQPASTASPLKEKHYNRLRRQDAASRRMAALRRKRENITREKLTMYDLIFYNPISNPIIPDQDEIKAKEENAKEEADRASKYKSKNEEEADEEDVDDPPEGDAAPVPQIKLGVNGEIILDETSLVIKQTDKGRKVSSMVREGAWAAGGGKYKRRPRTADWADAETVRFYRALAAIGTDFTLMAQLFPDRTRKDLKLKFKKEERVNCAQVDKALRSATEWDAARLQHEFSDERAEAKRRAQLERELLAERKRAERERMQAAREMRVRNSKGAKAIESSMVRGVGKMRTNEVTTADEILERAMECDENRAAAASTPQTVQGVVPSPQFATLTLINKIQASPKLATPLSASNLAATPYAGPSGSVASVNPTPAVPPNIETGSLVVLTVNDPLSPSKKMLQTYIAQGGGRLTPVALPTTLLNSVVGYMKKGTPKAASSNSSPRFASPNSASSHDSRTSAPPSVIQVNPNPAKRQRHSSFTITQL